MADLLKLTSLIAAAQATVATKTAIKSAEVKVKTARTAVEREEAQTEVNDMLAIVDWRSTALVLVFDEWECACGRRGKSPQGIFFFQEHTRLANATRLVPPRSESEGNDLPKRRKYEHRIVSVCAECCFEAGFVKDLAPQQTVAERLAALKRPGMYQTEWETLRRQREQETP